jgi:hypothetical protein
MWRTIGEKIMKVIVRRDGKIIRIELCLLRASLNFASCSLFFQISYIFHNLCGLPSA